MEASFDVRGKEFKVVFSMFGSEKYYFDGELLKKRWNFKFNDRLVFETNEGKVEIVVSLSPKAWSTQAFLDNELVVEELFPEFKQKVENSKQTKGMSKSSMFKIAILWCALTVMFLLIFQWAK
ncbi:hypothetical protein [Pseudoalteromonas byunsanensis]|uniref:Uncharacterized protein n=1 Tax=Pseudoalteromonas byunsanensis TaxID=327939 RepID=A0A1S1N2Y9_9GAMM|nr:hypothetical protein [Pseudoalteromonas byunsanensis]OHU94370.1 hypothetical protein BIW53_14925 [Pseudoalteromonas byunsanensis]